jgi:hypothetical protein
MTISLLRHLTPGHEALSPCGIGSYAIDCRTQSCPNTRWRRIGGGNRAADTALTRSCQQCLPVTRGTPSGLAPFAGNGILRTEPHAPRCEAACGLPCFKTTPAKRNSHAPDKGPPRASISHSATNTPSPNWWGSGRERIAKAVTDGVCAVECPESAPHSLPAPLPGAASGCNVKPNAQAAATEAAAERLAVTPLAGVLDACWTAVLCRSQAISRIYDCSARCRESP